VEHAAADLVPVSEETVDEEEPDDGTRIEAVEQQIPRTSNGSELFSNRAFRCGTYARSP
jgi:hypothetical protein